MSDKNLLDPAQNELIPTDAPSHDNDGTLLDPRCNELIEDDGPTIEPPKRVLVQTGDLMSVLTNIAEGGSCNAEEAAHGCESERVEIASGLIAVHCPNGGLSMFRNGKQIFTTEDLTPEERQAMLDFREKCK